MEKWIYGKDFDSVQNFEPTPENLEKKYYIQDVEGLIFMTNGKGIKSLKDDNSCYGFKEVEYA
jgi:hypothetical protein